MAPMWLLILTVLLPASERPVPPARFYEPRLPSIEWARTVDLKEAAPVVVVASRIEAAKPPAIFGNGVIVEVRDMRSRILTCAHVVRANSKNAIEIRVGIFRHSFVEEVPERAEYEEFEASVLHVNDRLDLALLEIPTGGTRAATIALEVKQIRRQRHLISIVPFGKPTLTSYTFHAYIHKGQSGSPQFTDGSLVGIASTADLAGRGFFVYSKEILRFLEEVRDFSVNLCDPSV